MAQNEEKDFLDFELDDPLAAIGSESALAAPVKNDSGPVDTGVLLYEGRKYAVGLSWLVGDESGNNSLATKRAKGFGADFYCMRANVVSQHGFGWLNKGHRIGMPVLASVVADVFVGEWHGIFAADNGWWYVAVHADNIAPEGDRFFTSEEEAYNFFTVESKGYRWPRAYAPSSWNLSDTTSEIPLSKIIGEANAPTLKPVGMDAIFSGKRNRQLALAGGFLIICLVVAGVLGQQFLPSLIPAPAQLPMPNLEVSDDLQAPPEEPVLIAEKEANNLSQIPLAPPPVFIQKCLQNLSAITLPIPGWNLTDIRCKDTFVEASWSKLSGSIEMAQSYLDRIPQDANVKLGEGGLLIQRQIRKEKEGDIQSRPLSDKNQVMIALNKRFAALGTFTTLETTPQATQQLLQGMDMLQQAGLDNVMQNAPQMVPLTYNDLPFISLTLNTRTPPTMLSKYFDMPGMIMDEIAGTIGDGGWIYTAKIIPLPDKRLIEANIKAKTLQAEQQRAQ